MYDNIPEEDWQKIKSFKDEALNKSCEKILGKVDLLIKSRGTESHRYYLKLWKLMQKEDKRIAAMFDDLKRSTAIPKLAAWRVNGILSDDELSEFSEETQKKINSICSL